MSVGYATQSPAREETLFRIAQEPLHNVVKHARATRVEVRLESTGEVARLLVRDDGVGLPQGAKRRRSTDVVANGLGLMTMRERAGAWRRTADRQRARRWDDAVSLHGGRASRACVRPCGAGERSARLRRAVPPLLYDTQILEAFRSCFGRLVPGGVLIISVRDYAGTVRRSPDVHPRAMHVEEGRRRLAVQAWEWDGDQYDVRLYLTEEHPDGSRETQLLRSRFYAISVGRLLQLMREAGFFETERRDGVLFQPVLVGIRPSE